MEVTPSHRLKEFLDKLAIPFDEFARAINCPTLIGQSDKYVYNPQKPDKKKSTMSLKFYRNFYLIGLNKDWYLEGTGEMLSTKETKNIVSEPFIEFKPNFNHQNIGVPYYELDVTGSILETFSDSPEKPEFYVDFRPFNDCIAYFPIYGDSMYPMYQSGEIVAVKKIDNFDILLWGETHLIITNSEANNYRTIKQIFQHPEDDKIILRAYNTAFPGDTVVKKEYILGIYIIKGKISKNML